MNNGFEAIKEEHQILAARDHSAERNPQAVLAWVAGELLNGKVLILPPAIHAKAVAMCREMGMPEEAIQQIHESKQLPTHA